jgi:hypothetical protein
MKRKSSYSNPSGNCIVVNMIPSSELFEMMGVQVDVPEVVQIENDAPGFEAMSVICTPEDWRAFIKGVKDGEFDLDEADQLIVVEPLTYEGLTAEQRALLSEIAQNMDFDGESLERFWKEHASNCETCIERLRGNVSTIGS